MICVSIGRGRHRHMIVEHRHLVEQGAKLVELRIDYIASRVNLKRLLQDRPSPVIITCRRERDGGKFTGSEEQRLMLLRSAIAEGAEYVDLEDDVAEQIPRFGATKRIVSLHNFRKTPDDLPAINRRLAAMDADLVKIACMANHPHDNVRMLQMIQQAKVPTLGMCMGEMGMPTRILAGRFGSPFVYATFHHERALSPGQLSFDQMVNTYNYDTITERSQIFGVIGDPIGHSLSPHVLNAAFRDAGLDAVYIPFRVPSADLDQFIDNVGTLGIRSLSITIPHKEAIARRLTKIDPAVKGIEAVNTVVFKNQDIIGYNTDYKAAMDSLEIAMGAQQGDESPLQGKLVLLLGAGGVARAIAYGLARRGAHTIVSSRSRQRAEALAFKHAKDVVDWDARHKVNPDVLINCTPVGMHPNVDDSPFLKRHLRPSLVVFDTVYNPESTLLIKDARSMGCQVITGVEMFVRQAWLQFKLFTGREAKTSLMREVVKRETGPVRSGSAE